MEIRTYLSIIGRYWWVIALVVVGAMGGAAALDAVKAPVYTTHARVVVRPKPGITDERTLADILGQLAALYLANTFAQTFTSAQVKADTLKALNVSSGQVQSYTLAANRLPDTIVIDVNGSGPDPTFLANYVNATVTAAVNDSRDLFRVVEMMPLDAAAIPRQPSSPVPTRDIPTGAALGLAIGVLLVLLIDYLRGEIISVTRRGQAAASGTTIGPDPTTVQPSAYADWTRPMETVEAPPLVGEDNQAAANDGGWLPVRRQRKQSAGRDRG